MAVEQPGTQIGWLPADADLSTKQYYCVKFSSTGVALCSAAGERCDGILQNDPVAGQPAAVMKTGVSKAVASGALTAGTQVTTDANGKLKAVVAGRTDTSDAGAAADPLLGSYVLGTLLETSTADGDIVSVDLDAKGAVPTTAS